MNRHVGNGSLVGTPAVGWNDTAYVGSLDMSIYCLDGNGSLWWDFNTSAPIWSSPTIVGNSTIYITSAGLMSFTLDGDLNWRALQNVTSRSSPAVSSDGTIYFGPEDGGLYAVSDDGTVLWKFLASGPVRSSPSIDDGQHPFRNRRGDGLLHQSGRKASLVVRYRRAYPVLGGHWSRRDIDAPDRER